MHERAAALDALARHTGGVLVVEDDELVGNALVHMLRHAGFEARPSRRASMVRSRPSTPRPSTWS
ncbi:MAG: response regulator [Nannocystaceae bacterium]